MREPAFWWRKPGLASALLAPLGAIYGAEAARRMTRAGARAGLPVICVGNFTLGGAGKTPTVIALAALLSAAGERVFCLTRGYGGSAVGPKRVDAHADRASEVGDEALLLARAAPTIVSRDRVAGAALAMAQGASLVILDDGLQNGSLAKDFTLAVVDARRGIGNARIFPAGPLRAPLDAQLARCDAMLTVGEGDGADPVTRLAEARRLAVLHGRLVPDADAVRALHGRRVLAFAGIGDPEKFFAGARAAGVEVAKTRAFADHHRHTAEEAAELMMEADEDALVLLTTEKDRARMIGDPMLDALAQRAHVLPVTMQIDDAEALRAMVMAKVPR